MQVQIVFSPVDICIQVLREIFKRDMNSFVCSKDLTKIQNYILCSILMHNINCLMSKLIWTQSLSAISKIQCNCFKILCLCNFVTFMISNVYQQLYYFSARKNNMLKLSPNIQFTKKDGEKTNNTLKQSNISFIYLI